MHLASLSSLEDTYPTSNSPDRVKPLVSLRASGSWDWALRQDFLSTVVKGYKAFAASVTDFSNAGPGGHP